MRATIEIDGEPFDVSVATVGDRVRVTCDDRTRNVPVRRDDGLVRLGPPIDQEVQLTGEEEARIGERRVRFAVVALEADETADEGDGGRPVRAVMPGRLVKVLVRAGERVERGAPLFVLEAMKMQNELASPAAGVVSDLAVREGDVVEVGRVLARIAQERPKA